ncbi:hypothetical protein DFH08DRAFT_822165 [Mycena albidolilacea]|uniref:Uncharacterized protein n=1 Tax=Mycena albidolilacea TaxID=1033008 RepID=A0AAD6Z9F3_9AGAR|nr:hypothetical protein DFH08DRAFT_822165 [Mycena albidolilacea]
MFKFWDLGDTPTPAANQPPAASLPQPPPFPTPAARAPRTVCPTCGCQGNALCRTNRCKTDCRAHSTVSCKIHDTLQPPAAQPAVQPSVPRPPPNVRPGRSLGLLIAGLEDVRAAFNTPQRLAQLTQDHLAQQQEQAARLAALTPLPPSPTRSQEDRDRDMAVRLALGSSPPPHTAVRQTHRITLSHWLSSGPGRTTVVQDQPGWETTWPRIRLDDLVPFLTSSTHPCPDQYYDYWNFSLGVWVAIPLAYDFTVLTDEPILICRSGTFAADQAEMVAAFSHLVKRVISPAPASTRRKRSPSPSVQHARKHIKVKHDSSDDEIEVSAVRKLIKLEPHTPPAYRRLPPAVSPPFTSLVASTSRLPLPSPSPVASSLRLRLSPPSFDSRLVSSSPFPSPPSLLYSTHSSTPSSSMHSSTPSSSSLASPGSSSAFPISFIDKD